jgi:hypothetical protein
MGSTNDGDSDVHLMFEWGSGLPRGTLHGKRRVATTHRVEGQQSERTTRQATSTNFPPQHEKSSLVSRLVETWEKLPVHVQGEEKQSVVKKKIKSWARHDNGGGGRRTGFHTRDLQQAS